MFIDFMVSYIVVMNTARSSEFLAIFYRLTLSLTESIILYSARRTPYPAPNTKCNH